MPPERKESAGGRPRAEFLKGRLVCLAAASFAFSDVYVKLADMALQTAGVDLREDTHKRCSRLQKLCESASRRAARAGDDYAAAGFASAAEIADDASQRFSEMFSWNPAGDSEIGEWLKDDYKDEIANGMTASEEELQTIGCAAEIWSEITGDESASWVARESRDQYSAELRSADLTAASTLFAEICASLKSNKPALKVPAGVAALAGFADIADRLPAEEPAARKSQTLPATMFTLQRNLSARTRGSPMPA